MLETITITLSLIFFISTLALLLQTQRHKATIRQLTTLDDITGLKNTHTCFTQLETLFLTAKRYHQPLTVALVQFTGLNDAETKLGREPVSRYLKQVASELDQQLRTTDLLGRIHFDVFLVALTYTNTHDSRAVFERIHQALKQYQLEDATVKIALGVTQLHLDTENFTQFMQQAKSALDEANRQEGTGIHYIGH